MVNSTTQANTFNFMAESRNVVKQHVFDLTRQYGSVEAMCVARTVEELPLPVDMELAENKQLRGQTGEKKKRS